MSRALSLTVEVGMCRRLRSPDNAPQGEWGVAGAGCHMVSNPVLTLFAYELHPLLCVSG